MRCPHYMETLESAINTLAEATRFLPAGTSKRLLRNLPLIRKMEEETKSSAQFGLNYGKPLQDHVILLEGNLLLLPTCDWYWGEVGPDYAEAAVWLGECGHASRMRGNSARLLLWRFVIAWRNMLRLDWYSKKVEPLWEQTANDALTALDRLKSEIIP